MFDWKASGMTWNTIAITMIATFIYVFLRAQQQINVIRSRYFAVVPCSLAMGICEVVILLYVVRANTIWLGLLTGLAGGAGVLVALMLNRKIAR